MTTSEKLVEMLEDGYMIVFELLEDNDLIAVWSNYNIDERFVTGSFEEIVNEMYQYTILSNMG